MGVKSWFASTTIWLNLVGIVVIRLQVILGSNLVIDPEIQALILAILNLLNRFRTRSAIK